MTNQTVLIGGKSTVVNANNWESLARLKIDEVRAARPDSPPAEQLAIYRAFQVMGGKPDAFNQQNPDGTVKFNDFGASNVINNPFVRAADAAQNAERAVIGQGGVDALKRISDTTWGQVKSVASVFTEKLPAAGKNVAGWLSGLSTTVKFVSVAVAAGAVLLIVYKVKK